MQLIYRSKIYEGSSKDYEFSRATMLEHWASGHADVERTLRNEAWLKHSLLRGTTTYDLTGDGKDGKTDK